VSVTGGGVEGSGSKQDAPAQERTGRGVVTRRSPGTSARRG